MDCFGAQGVTSTKIGAAALALLGASAPISAATPAYPPFSWEDVGFERDCTPNPALARVLGMMSGHGGAADPDAPVDFDEPLHNAVFGDIQQRLMIDGGAEWHGLRLIAVESYHGIERGPANYTLVFSDSRADVLAVWNRMGWRLPDNQEARDIAGLEGYASIAAQSTEGGATHVTCFRD